MVIVDRHHLPGGHWNDAYPFVTLHQPSAFYGVNSRELSTGLTDQTGWNQGLGDLATGAEINAYFDQVMRHRLLTSGRVRYFPMCEYLGEATFSPILGGRRVSVRRKTVDTTHLRTSVPLTHTPSFTVDDGVRFLPLNGLPGIADSPDDFVVIGGGKTGIDACLWLLDKGVDPERIRWIMPRDAWLLDWRNTQASPSSSSTPSAPRPPSSRPSLPPYRSTTSLRSSRRRVCWCGSTRRCDRGCSTVRLSARPSSSSCDASTDHPPGAGAALGGGPGRHGRGRDRNVTGHRARRLLGQCDHPVRDQADLRGGPDHPADGAFLPTRLQRCPHRTSRPPARATPRRTSCARWCRCPTTTLTGCG